LFALCGAVVLDLLLGDPVYPLHPIRLIGHLISGLEKLLRRCFPKTAGGERIAGIMLVVLTIGISTGLTAVLLWLCSLVSVWLRLAVEMILSYQLLAARSLEIESMRVFVQLRRGNLPKARRAVGRIVGRDTQTLNEEEITKAAVETVAENTSDGVIAPLLFLALGGAPLGMLYKACNTMDSMVGYQNQQYRYFGWCAAKLDDLLNWIPARLSGMLMCLVSGGEEFDRKNAWKIYRRDRRSHTSPNSAHTEAACAGALGLQLGGTHTYFGKPVSKPTIGDELRPVAQEDIPRADQLMYRTELAALILVLVCWFAISLGRLFLL
jgi:adenosylcobinamide-phosphate synthase